MRAEDLETAKHPRGIYLVSGTQMWERFSYFGMVGLLPLFLSAAPAANGFGWSEMSALRFLGLYMALTYVSPVIGGWIVDRHLGLQRGMLAGCSLMICGHFTMAMPSAFPAVVGLVSNLPVHSILVNSGIALGGLSLTTGDEASIHAALAQAGHLQESNAVVIAYLGISWSFYAAITLLIAGAGLFIPAATVMVGEFYPAGSSLRDSGYSLFYTAVNIGAFLGSLVVGFIGERIDWHLGFTLAGFALLFGLIVFLSFRQQYIGDIGKRLVDTDAPSFKHMFRLAREDVNRIKALLILGVFYIIFWIGYAQTEGLFNLYIYQHVDRVVAGFNVPATWLLALASLYVILLGPVFAGLWTKLEKRGIVPSAPAKFAAGLLAMAGCYMLVFVAMSGVDSGGRAAIWWFVVAYLMLVTGEMCVGPVAFATVTRWAPPRMATFMMGAWFLNDATSYFLAGEIGALAKGVGEVKVVLSIALAAALAAFLLLCLKGWIVRLADDRPSIATR